MKSLNKTKINAEVFEFISSNYDELQIENLNKYYEIDKNDVLNDKANRITIIDRLFITDGKNKEHIGSLKRIGLDKIEVDESVYKKYGKILYDRGIFAKIVLELNTNQYYQYYIDSIDLEPLEDFNTEFKDFKNNFHKKNLKYRLNLILHSLGYNPDKLLFWEKIFYIIRAIPMCESSYNLMDLGIRGSGKDYIYNLFKNNTHVYTGQATSANIFYNESKSEKGNIFKVDTLVFNEMGKVKIDKNDNWIELLKEYMDGYEISKKVEIPKEKSIVFLGNINQPKEKLENKHPLTDKLDNSIKESAFLDRISFFLPSWGIRKTSEDMKLKINSPAIPIGTLNKLLKSLRSLNLFENLGIEIKNIPTRDENSIKKTVSGLIKILRGGDIDNISSEELNSYFAIATLGRKLINRETNLYNPEEFSVNHLILDDSLREDLKSFIIKTMDSVSEDSFEDSYLIPNKLVLVSEDETHLIPLDSIGLESNEVIYKDLNEDRQLSKERNKLIIPNDISDFEFMGEDYFIDLDALNKDNLFDDILSAEKYDLDNDYYLDELNYDKSVIYEYKKNLPEKLECPCGKYAYLDAKKGYYYCDNCKFELEFKEVKKQFLEKCII